MSIPQQLQEATYISLATLRKNGKEVPTPVWMAVHNDHFYVFSESKAGKVKRIKNSSRSKIAACTMTGTVIGEWFDTESFIVSDGEEIEQAYRALREKYGWKMRLLDWGSKIAGKYHHRAMIKIGLTDPDSQKRAESQPDQN